MKLFGIFVRPCTEKKYTSPGLIKLHERRQTVSRNFFSIVDKKSFRHLFRKSGDWTERHLSLINVEIDEDDIRFFFYTS